MEKREPFYYKEISEAEVCPGILEKARGVLSYCRRILGLKDLAIQWVVESDGYSAGLAELELLVDKVAGKRPGESEYRKDVKGGFSGQTNLYTEKMLIRADIPVREILLTIAHECQHVKDSMTYRPPLTAPEQKAWEERAERFARKVVDLF